MKKRDIPRSKKIMFTGLNISDAARIASKSGMNISREEMLIEGIFIIPTNRRNENCIIYFEKSKSKKAAVMWCPSLDDLLSNDWVVFK